MEYTIAINAPAEKVWKTLWEDASYRAWTSRLLSMNHQGLKLIGKSEVRFYSQ